MAEFHFLATWNDCWEFVAALLAHGEYTLVPDLLYDKPEPVFITTLDDPAKGMLLVKRNGFLWSAKYSRWPPVMERIDGGEAEGKYCVGLIRGGPFLRLSLPGGYEEGGVLNLGPGCLYFQKWTTAPGSDVVIKASPELRQGYKEVKAIIKQHLVRLKVRPDIWGGQEANRLLEEGRARIRGFERPAPPESKGSGVVFKSPDV